MTFEAKIKVHASEFPEEEVCGFVLIEDDGSIRVERMKNESGDKQNCFHISPMKFLKYRVNNKILGIYHSHPKTTEAPSKADRAMSEELGIPYLIYGLRSDKFFLYYPESYEPGQLTSRPYVKSFYECVCVWKDYYKKFYKWNKNYWLPEKDDKANELLLKILKTNTQEVERNKIKKNDVLVFELKEGKRLHIGVSTGNGDFIHQPLHALSRIDMLDDRWQDKIKYVFRHPSLV